MPSPHDKDPLQLRLIELLSTNTSLPAVSINALACTLTIFLRTNGDDFIPGSYGEVINLDDLALVICRCTEKEGRYMALVEYYGMDLKLIIKGDVKESRSDVVNGLRDQVEQLLGRKVGDAFIE